MAALFDVVLTANLAKEPEMQYLDNGKAITRLTIAYEDPSKRKEELTQEDTTWITVALFEKRAEWAAQYLKKGSVVRVIGQLLVRKYTRKDGTAGQSIEIHRPQVDFAPKPWGDGQAATAPAGQGGGDEIPF